MIILIGSLNTFFDLSKSEKGSESKNELAELAWRLISTSAGLILFGRPITSNSFLANSQNFLLRKSDHHQQSPSFPLQCNLEFEANFFWGLRCYLVQSCSSKNHRQKRWKSPPKFSSFRPYSLIITHVQLLSNISLALNRQLSHILILIYWCNLHVFFCEWNISFVSHVAR